MDETPWILNMAEALAMEPYELANIIHHASDWNGSRTAFAELLGRTPLPAGSYYEFGPMLHEAKTRFAVPMATPRREFAKAWAHFKTACRMAVFG